MLALGFACLILAIAALTVQIASNGLAIYRCRPNRRRIKPDQCPPITLVRPLCGLEHFSRETLRSTFTIDYPRYEILFCVAGDADPILPLVRAVMRRGCKITFWALDRRSISPCSRKVFIRKPTLPRFMP